MQLYLINYGIAPHFKEILLNAINLLPFHSLYFDESMNSILQNGQMDVGVRYWDEQKACVYIASYSFYTVQICSVWVSSDCIKRTSKERFVQVPMDGPSVNRKVIEKLDNMLIKNDIPKQLILAVVANTYCIVHLKLLSVIHNGILIKSWEYVLVVKWLTG